MEFIYTCQWCGEEKISNQKDREFCSNTCAIWYKETFNIKINTFRTLRTCLECGRRFRRPGRKQLCSPLCKKVRAKRQQQEYKCSNIFSIFVRDNYTCIYCGRSSLVDGIKLTCDHVIPESLGGRTIASNIGTACSICNGQKYNNRLPLELEAQILEKISKRNLAAHIDPDQKIKLTNKYYKS